MTATGACRGSGETNLSRRVGGKLSSCMHHNSDGRPVEAETSEGLVAAAAPTAPERYIWGIECGSSQGSRG